MNNIKEVFRYVLAGLINTAVGYGIFIFFVYIITINPFFANIISYIVAICIAYILNKLFVFKDKNSNKQNIIKFLIAFFIAFTINFIALFIFLNIFNFSPAIGQVFAMIIYTTVFFLLNKFYVFNYKGDGHEN